VAYSRTRITLVRHCQSAENTTGVVDIKGKATSFLVSTKQSLRKGALARHSMVVNVVEIGDHGATHQVSSLTLSVSFFCCALRQSLTGPVFDVVDPSSPWPFSASCADLRKCVYRLCSVLCSSVCAHLVHHGLTFQPAVGQQSEVVLFVLLVQRCGTAYQAM